jgi:hypothetical protein
MTHNPFDMDQRADAARNWHERTFTRKGKTMNATQKASMWNFLGNLGKPKRLLSALAIAGGLALAAGALPTDALAQAAGKKPNIRHHLG